MHARARTASVPQEARLDTLALALYVVAGATVGGLLNVGIDRLPTGRPLATPPPHCEDCDRPLSIWEMAPILGYLALRGRCRTCGAPIPWRILAVEVGTAALFGVLWRLYGPGWPVLVLSAYTAILIAIFFIDLEHRLVLNRVTYPSVALALAFSALRTLPGDPFGLAGAVPGLLACAAGGLAGFVVIFIPAWLTKGGIGVGDVKLGALMGLMLGLPAVIAGLFLGFAAGGLGAIVLLATRTRGRRDAVPYAPFLVVGAWLALLWGNHLMGWYLGRF